MRFAVADGLLHDQGIASVEATCDVGDIDQGEKLEVWPARPVTVLYMLSVTEYMEYTRALWMRVNTYSFSQITVNQRFLLDRWHSG